MSNSENILTFIIGIVSIIGLLYFVMVAKFVDPKLLYDISTFGNIMNVLILQVLVINTLFLSRINDQLIELNKSKANKK